MLIQTAILSLTKVIIFNFLILDGFPVKNIWNWKFQKISKNAKIIRDFWLLLDSTKKVSRISLRKMITFLKIELLINLRYFFSSSDSWPWRWKLFRLSTFRAHNVKTIRNKMKILYVAGTGSFKISSPPSSISYRWITGIKKISLITELKVIR